MTAAEIYDSVTNGGASDFATVVRVLRGHGPWCLIGGLAVNCYVEPVYTVDVDIVVLSEAVAAIADKLTETGFTIQRFPHSVNAKKPKSDLAVQLTQDKRYQPFVGRAQIHDVLGQTIPVAAVRDVVQGKVWAWSDPERRLSKRKKDELDLIRLGEAYPELRVQMPREIVTQLEGGAK